MTRQEKVIKALETLALHSGYPLEISVYKPQDIWLIKFVAGYAGVQTSMELFIKTPMIVFEPFGEELIRRNL